MDSSSYQRFSKSVGRYQGLRPHSDEYKTLEKSWLSYVCHERSVAGILESPLPVVGHANAVLELAPSLQTASSELHRFLPCSCGKSGTSYPRWPPSCHEEAFDQLRCLSEAYPTPSARVAELPVARAVPGGIGSTGEEYSILISLLRNSCPTLFLDDETSDDQAEGPKQKFECKSFGCERVIRENLSL